MFQDLSEVVPGDRVVGHLGRIQREGGSDVEAIDLSIRADCRVGNDVSLIFF